MYSVYTLQCLPTGKRYVGMTCDPSTRFRTHASKPLRCMRKDVKKYTPFDENFTITFDRTFVSEHAAVLRERALIAQWRDHQKQQGGPGVYNVLRGAPSGSNQFWHLLRSGRIRSRV